MFVLLAFDLYELVPDVESDSAELEAEPSPRKLAFLFHRWSYCIFFKAWVSFLASVNSPP